MPRRDTGGGEEDLIARLARAGLTLYEARAYLALLKLGGAKPLELARTSRIPRQRIYDVVKSLEEKGLAERDGDRVKPRSPEEAMERLASQKLARALVEAMETRRLALLLPKPASEGPREASRIVRGVEESVAEALTLLSTCREPPLIVAYKVLDRLQELWPLLQALLDQAGPGTVILVPDKARIPMEYVRRAEEAGARIVYDKCAFLDALIACNTVIIGVPSEAHTVETLILENPLLAKTLKERLQGRS